MSVVSEWTAALRSGQYPQTKNVLAKADRSGFCCLGVACDLFADRAGVRIYVSPFNTAGEHEFDVVCYDEEHAELPLRVGQLLNVGIDHIGSFKLPLTAKQKGKTVRDGNNYSFSLAELNDQGFTFNQIADIIDYFFGGEE